MSIAGTNTPSRHPGLSKLVQIAMAGTRIGLLVASVIKFREQESAREKVHAVIEEKVLARGGLDVCSVLFGTQPHEGRCGALGKYTVLTIGSDLHVSRANARQPSNGRRQDSLGLPRDGGTPAIRSWKAGVSGAAMGDRPRAASQSITADGV